MPAKRVTEICIRLAKHKKENKELLDYLLFEAGNEETFVSNVKEEIDIQFRDLNKSNLYLAKKTLRKVLRTVNKFTRYSGIKKTELELRIYYCRKFLETGIDYTKNKVLFNLYNNQLSKIDLTLSKLHEDVQFDFLKEISELKSQHL